MKPPRCLLPVLLVLALGGCHTDPEDLEAREVARLMRLKSGATVADTGAGDGRFTVALAEHLGRGVRVFATELGRPALAALRNGVQRGGAGNVTLVEGAAAETNLPVESCDAIVLRRTYHHFKLPEAMAASLLRALRPGGRLFVIEQPLVPMKATLGVPVARGGDGIMPPTLVEELTAAGFHHERTVNPFVRELYLVVMRKP